MCILLLERLWWLQFAPPAIYLFSFLLVFFGALIPLRVLERAGDAHWTERARLAYPVGKLLRWQQMFLITVFGVCGFFSGNLCSGGEFSWREGILYAAAAYLGSLSARYLIARRIYPELSGMRQWAGLVWIGSAAIWFSFAGVYFLTELFKKSFGWETPAAGGLAWVLFYAAMLSGAWHWPLRLSRHLRPAQERLRRLVAEACNDLGVAHPRGIYQLRSFLPNAWALPLAGELVFTDRLVASLSDAELKSVAAHELSHLSEPWPCLLRRYSPGFIFVPGIAVVIESLNTNSFVFVFVFLLIVIFFGRFTTSVSRKLEERADKGAVQSETEKGAYARALEHIYRISLIPASLPKKSQTHPDLYDRLLCAGIEPSYPRPALPPSGRMRFVAVVSVLIVALLGTAAVASFFDATREIAEHAGCLDISCRY